MTSVHEREDAELAPAVEAELAEPVATIGRRLWAGTALLALALVVAVSWGWFGRWSQHLDATAIIVHGTGPVVAVAPGTGTVTAVPVRVGDTVQVGTALATVLSAGHPSAVRATSAGTVLDTITVGAHVDDGTVVAHLDPVAQQAHAYLLVSDTTTLARLDVGQPVTLGSAEGTRTGHISGVRTTPTTTAALAEHLVLPLTNRSDRPVWLVEVTLDPGSPTAQIEAQARVQLPSIRVYRALLGDGS